MKNDIPQHVSISNISHKGAVTGPSSGVVASIVLVSPGLECPGVSLVEVCATCLRCHLW